MILQKGLVFSARKDPQKLAIVNDKHRYTYEQLETRAAKVQASLKNLGVQKGDRVGLLLLNDFRYVELMYGVTSFGALMVPMNVRFSAEENLYVLRDAGVEVLYLNKEFIQLVPIIKKEVPSVRHIILAEDLEDESFQEEPDVLSYEALLQAEIASKLLMDEVTAEDVAGLFYTGGTTGRSKGVMLTHQNLVANAMHVVMNFNMHSDDIYLHASPMFHAADQAASFALTFIGGTHVTLRQFTPKGLLETIEKEQVSLVMLVPTMINMMIYSADFDKYDISTLRMILYGASPMAVELLKKSFEVMPHVDLIQAYGMTEASPILTLLLPKDHHVTEETEQRLASCGKPVQFVEMKVIGDNGEELGTNDIGEFVAKGPNIMKGYWNLEEETKKVFQEEWYHTGDMGYRDEDGFYYVVDRAKDMIISGGENVYSVEVEQALYTHPAVLECAVFGSPDEKWGEIVRGAVVLKQDVEATEEDILDHIRKQLANYKVPKSIEFLQELPKSGAGKILKRVIREQYVENTLS